MILTLAITTEKELVYDLPLEALKKQHVKWYWVDFVEPTGDEVSLLSDFFHFHPLAIEDCLKFVQQLKMDFYDDYLFVVGHSINLKTLEADEVDLFVSDNFVVT